MVARDDGTTDPFGRALCLVHGYEARDHTDTETGKDTTDDEERNSDGSSLHGYTDAEDSASGDDTHSSTEEVCHRSSEESTEEGTG